MPSVNKTSLGLNQWEGNEYPKRVDFNEDNKIIDKEISANKTDISNLQNNKSNIDHTHNYQQYKLTEDNGNCKFLTGVDLNNVRFTGFYKYEGDTVSNAPIPIVWGYLEVINADNHLGNNTEWVMQRVTLLESVGHNNATYIRGCQKGLWSKWSKVMFDGSFNMLAQQVSELEIQLLESEV